MRSDCLMDTEFLLGVMTHLELDSGGIYITLCI